MSYMEIILEMDINLKNKMIEKLSNKKLTIESYILELIEKDINYIVKLKNEFIFDFKTKKLFSWDNKEISLSKLELKLFICLLNNANKFISIEDIQKLVWEGKRTSSFNIRNKIMSIRNKTYKGLIKTSFNLGYMLII